MRRHARQGKVEHEHRIHVHMLDPVGKAQPFDQMVEPFDQMVEPFDKMGNELSLYQIANIW